MDVYYGYQYIFKIRLNSLYGALSTPYGRFYDTDLSEAITLTGQWVNKSTMKVVEDFYRNNSKNKDPEAVIVVIAPLSELAGIELLEVQSTFCFNV